MAFNNLQEILCEQIKGDIVGHLQWLALGSSEYLMDFNERNHK